MNIRKFLSLFLLVAFFSNIAQAGITIVKSSGITFTGADGITFTGADGVTFTGADGLLSYKTNGITFTGADGVTFTGADGVTFTGADSSTYTGTNRVTFTRANGVTFTGADGVTFTGADGVTFTGADGTQHQAASFKAVRPNGVTFTGADGIALIGADGYRRVGVDGVTFTGADGVTFTGADGVTFTGADSIVGVRTDGTTFVITHPNGVTFTGADSITLTGADGVTFTGADGVTFTGADGVTFTGVDNGNGTATQTVGLQSVSPELAIALNDATDDSNINAILVFHQYPSSDVIAKLQEIGITGGTLYRVLPMVSISTTREKIIAASRLPQVRSIHGNRTLNVNSDSYFKTTQVSRVQTDRDLQTKNAGMPVSGRNVTVAVLDTGVNSQHSDLAGKVVQNVRLSDSLSAPIGFLNPNPIENVVNTDPVSGHGTFVAGLIAASGASSGGKYNGVAPGANILGLSAGDLNLSFVLAGFDYLLERGANYNVKVVNCSFSAETVFDYNDPVNVATKLLTERGVNVVFSAGNTGAGNGTLNPYSIAPWVISVGATDEKANLAGFSSRGTFGNGLQKTSLVAPGVNVVSLRSAASQTGVFGAAGSDSNRLTPGEIPFYTTASGTSFSAPQVAGAIALMLEANPNLRPAEIKDILQRSATPLPNYYNHEVGAGMLNTYAAVLEAAFPWRRTGLFRSVLDRNVVDFSTSVISSFSGTVNPNTISSTNVSIPANVVQTSVDISWGKLTSPNDLGLAVYSQNGVLRGDSNKLNLPGLTGKREKVTVNNPLNEVWQVSVRNSLGIGTPQSFLGSVSATTVRYADFSDLHNLSLADQNAVYESLGSYLMLPEGKKFRPDWTVSRSEFAEALVRSGKVPQFIAANKMFSDVSDFTTRSAVESVQSNPSGKLIFDASNGSAYRPNEATTKLVAAVAFVKAAGLESLASDATLSLTVSDSSSIPAQLKGYVAVALQKGFLTLDGNEFNPNRSLSRLELTKAMVNITSSSN
ncbi:MAG: S8 family serine peptidase [Acidobacteriota bacterium]|nr:S8 family serine peptidase [Acidobacteriota bacterium]